jgi:hypothetical protein
MFSNVMRCAADPLFLLYFNWIYCRFSFPLSRKKQKFINEKLKQYLRSDFFFSSSPSRRDTLNFCTSRSSIRSFRGASGSPTSGGTAPSATTTSWSWTSSDRRWKISLISALGASPLRRFLCSPTRCQML